MRVQIPSSAVPSLKRFQASFLKVFLNVGSMDSRKLTVALVLTLVAGCVSQNNNQVKPNVIPSDFRLTYLEAYSMGKIEQYYMEINEVGDINVSQIPDPEGSFRRSKTFKLSKDELFQLYQTIQDENFFTMNNTYKKQLCVDGGVNELNVTAGEKKNEVEVSCTPNDQQHPLAHIKKRLIELRDKPMENVTIKTQTLNETCSEAQLVCRTRASFDAIKCRDWISICNPHGTG